MCTSHAMGSKRRRRGLQVHGMRSGLRLHLSCDGKRSPESGLRVRVETIPESTSDPRLPVLCSSSSSAAALSTKRKEMDVDIDDDTSSKKKKNSGPQDWSGRWAHVSQLLQRNSPLHSADFASADSDSLLNFVRHGCRVLVIGAGGLGCELLKNLALMGFGDVHVIDMDTIDLSNLNRQFLFRRKDIGQPKAVVAADAVMRRVSGSRIVAHVCRIEDCDRDFYAGFHLVLCGLDSIAARRWISAMLLSLWSRDDKGEVDVATMVPLIDGGTEGLKGSVRVLMTGVMSACTDCTRNLFPPPVRFPLCTIAHTPRLPEHCIEYVKLLLWPKEQPFGAGVPLDADNGQHVHWVHEQAVLRAERFHIPGLTFHLTLGVVKRIIAAVASTNAVVAAAEATEAFKLATSAFPSLDNYFLFSDETGVHTFSFAAQRDVNCLSCRPDVVHRLSCRLQDRLSDVVSLLKDKYQFLDPGISTTNPVTGRNRTLFMPSPEVMRTATAANLTHTLANLSLTDNQVLYVNDKTTPRTVSFVLSFTSSPSDVASDS